MRGCLVCGLLSEPAPPCAGTESSLLPRVFALPLPLRPLGLASSEKQIPQVVEKYESGEERKEALERAVMRPRQVTVAESRERLCAMVLREMDLSTKGTPLHRQEN